MMKQEDSWEENELKLRQLLQQSDHQIKIREVSQQDKKRYSLNMDDLREHSPALVEAILRHPQKAIRVLQQEISLLLNDLFFDGKDPESKNVSSLQSLHHAPQVQISFGGNLGRQLVTPRGLSAELVDRYVGVQGIVTRVGKVYPLTTKTVHYCDKTKVTSSKTYQDPYDLTLSPEEQLQQQTRTIPTKDAEGNPLVMDYGLCSRRNQQKIIVQEMVEKAPVGQLPTSVEVILQDDLVDTLKPGDRCQVNGVYKSVVNGLTFAQGLLKTVLVATELKTLSLAQDQDFHISPEDLVNIRKIAQGEYGDTLELLARSMAPSIHGHENMKKGLVLLLLGGVEKVLETGTKIRGDLNVMMIGDPSTAKSQMLRRILELAPLAVNTTGRGSSGVGLTAAVGLDKDSGEKHLEAGAMVLADRGVVCIDEFDKMAEIDRVAIHEVMEQQTVTIAKAGIHASLNARCSVVAAANPRYGEYDTSLPAGKNINLPDSLLSRFDLVFIVLDHNDSELDRLIADRVCRNHRYVNPQQHTRLEEEEELNFIEDTTYQTVQTTKPLPFQKHDATIHPDSSQQLLTTSFFKKYVFYAKKQYQPSLNDEAIEYISNRWMQMRQVLIFYDPQKQASDSKDSRPSTTKYPATNLPVSIRTFESMIRLATGHAKVRLSKTVQLVDCEVAVQLVYLTVFGMDFDLNHSSRPTMQEIPQEDDKGQHLAEIMQSRVAPKGVTTRSARKEQKEEDDMHQLQEMLNQQTMEEPTISQEQYSYLFRKLNSLGASNVGKTIEQVQNYLATFGDNLIPPRELRAALQGLIEKNKVMLDEANGLYYLL